MSAKRNRPAGEAGRSQVVFADTPILPARADADKEMPPTTSVLHNCPSNNHHAPGMDITALILQDRCAFDIWLNGYQYGMAEGAVSARQDDQELAEYAARLAVANLEVQEDVRQTVRRTREWIDVALAREKRRIANESGPHEPEGGPAA